MIILFFIKHLPTIFQGFVDIIKIPLKLILVKGVRNFAPIEGIPEEPATGSACGAMAAFIIKHIFLPAFKINNSNYDCNYIFVQVTIEQGSIFGCPSIIIANVHYDIKANAFVSVKVSGRFNEKSYKRSVVFV